MSQHDQYLADQFETQRGHLRAVAYRMLGSLTEADDAVQEAWLRLHRADTSDVQNLGGWLTTVVGRVCLDMLRSRTTRREDPLDVHIPDPVIDNPYGIDPEHQAVLADSVGLALLVVLETLTPAERLAFVLHDMFAVPFDDIAPIVGRTPDAARQLASRARRRVQGGTPTPDPDPHRQKQVVEAFLAAARGGDFDALVAVLDPDVVLRADFGDLPVTSARILHGATTVASQAILYHRFARNASIALINGAYGLVTVHNGTPVSVMGFTVADGKVAALDVLADPARLAQLDLTMLGE